jgi:integrase
MRLTDVAIRQMPLLGKGQKRIRDDTLPGFGVTVGTARKTFFVMYGNERKLKTLGHWPETSLKDARQAARLILAKPPVVRRSVTFKEARDEFLDDCRSRLRKSTADRYYFALKDIAASNLDSVSLDITDATQLKSLKVFYNWCMDRGLTDTNPFARRRITYGQRDRVLTDEEVKAIWTYERKPYSDIVKMLLLTGQRRAQFANFQRDWIEDDTIVFPASVMKSGRQHIIPFLPEWELYLPNQSSNSWSKNKRHMDETANVSGYVLHDFRRYFSTTCAKIGVPLHITEFILDHRTQVSGVAAIYNRYSFLDEMRDALRQYDKWLSSMVLRQVKT